jgi:exonuclease VII large subunit
MSALRVIVPAFIAIALAALPTTAQNAPVAQGQAAAPQSPVSYSSMNQLNELLGGLQQSSQAALANLSKLRIDKWKTDANNKRQAKSMVESLTRNLQDALPGMLTEVRNAPEDLAASFKLYHNLDAVHDVLGSVAEDVGAFGPKEDYQPIANEANNLDNLRSQLAARIQTLAAGKEAELNRLRTALAAAQAAPPAPPKKTVVDDTEPEKPVRKKKKTAKPATAATPAKPATGTPPEATPQ